MKATNPAKINMSLGTAQQIMKNPAGYKPHIVAAARLIVAKWAKRSTVRVQQAWELLPSLNGSRIPAAPIGTRFAKILPTPVWPRNAADDELVSFTGVQL